jgi:hypothetical protein
MQMLLAHANKMLRPLKTQLMRFDFNASEGAKKDRAEFARPFVVDSNVG